MEFWAALCIAGGAAIGALAFAFCLLKLLICYESHQRLQWADMIRERRAAQRSEIGEVLAKAQTVCITDPTVHIAIARAPRPAWPESASETAAKPADWVVVIQPSENESA